MNEQVSDIRVTKDSLHDWINKETAHLDIVASWESLYSTYDALRFTDELSDAERLDEFKWVIQQMNAFLTRIRKKLIPCRDADTMLTILGNNMLPQGKMELEERRALVYQKLKQQWIKMMMSQLMMVTDDDKEVEENAW